ncbi:hypothetical protein GCM10025770_13680 [Viridibacterium curvum]|uniref:Uncharacterized protein n=1 Tax=Viridibacterium curvum TaxID=1101404 RepID=A0ABP9QIX4_9RHOO
MAVGERDSVARDQAYIFDRMPFHLRSSYIEVYADHIGVPAATRGGDRVVDGLKGWREVVREATLSGWDRLDVVLLRA